MANDLVAFDEVAAVVITAGCVRCQVIGKLFHVTWKSMTVAQPLHFLSNPRDLLYAQLKDFFRSEIGCCLGFNQMFVPGVSVGECGQGRGATSFSQIVFFQERQQMTVSRYDALLDGFRVRARETGALRLAEITGHAQDRSEE